MEPYKKFIRSSYVKKFNHFLKSVVEPKFKKKYHKDIELKLYGIGITPKSSVYDAIPKEELLDSQTTVSFFIDTEPSYIRTNFIEDLILIDGKTFLQLQNADYMGYEPEKFRLRINFNNRPLYPLSYSVEDNLNEEVEPSERAVKNICDAKKFCKAQGKITFGQLKEIVTNAKARRLYQHIGEGGYKATLRILPWFFPQLAIAGFTGSLLRAFNKIFRPGIEETTGYKTWWGKTIMKIFDLVEGELGIGDPLSKIFFISDGLMTMLDDKLKVKFARYIAEVASEKPDDEEVPEYFVENELRKYLNEKFLLDPPLNPKNVKKDEDLPFNEVEENGIKRRVFKENVNDHELKWHFDKKDRKVKIVKSNGWQIQLEDKLPQFMNVGETLFIPKGVYHRVIKGQGDLVVEIKEFEKNNLILEDGRRRDVIKTLVKDIIKIYKEEYDGEFYLPKPKNDEENDFYQFPGIDSLVVILTLQPDKNLETFRVNGEFINEDGVIQILIVYNPKNKTKITYDLIGELNEVVAHEIRHIDQQEKGTFDLSGSEDEDSYKYYTQPHELDALNFGFKRMARITKKPIETLVQNWFDKNEDIHRLNPEQKKDIIKKILNYKK